MVDFVFSSGKKGWLYGNRGTVTGALSARAEVDGAVADDDGAGRASRGRRQGAAGEFLVKSRTGRETQIFMALPVHEGHDFLVVWGDLDDAELGDHLYWKNFTTGEDGFFPGSVRPEFFQREADRKLVRKGFWGSWAVFTLLAYGMISALSPSAGDTGSKYFSALMGTAIAGGTVNLGLAHLATNLLFKGRLNRRLDRYKRAIREFSHRDDLALNG